MILPPGLDLPPFARPRLVVSRCLELAACRYDGDVVRAPLVARLADHVDLLPVCPEVEIGLGVPRDPIRLVRRGAETALVQPATGRDLTGAMAAFSGRFLAGLPDVDGFLLKARSPSCGVHGVKVFAGAQDGAPSGRDAGMFASAVRRRFPDHPAEHEARLGNPRLRDHFLTRLFALADARRAREQGAAGLAAFHVRHALTRATFPAAEREVLEAVVAGLRPSGVAEAWGRYLGVFRRALAPTPAASAQMAAVQLAADRLGDALPSEDRRRLAALEEGFRGGRVPRCALLALLAGCAHSGRDRWLAGQAWLRPFPPELASA